MIIIIYYLIYICILYVLVTNKILFESWYIECVCYNSKLLDSNSQKMVSSSVKIVEFSLKYFKFEFLFTHFFFKII